MSEPNLTWEIMLPGDSETPMAPGWVSITVFGRVETQFGVLSVWSEHDQTYTLYGPGRWAAARRRDVDRAPS